MTYFWQVNHPFEKKKTWQQLAYGRYYKRDGPNHTSRCVASFIAFWVKFMKVVFITTTQSN